jgi:hypothetical protein
MPATALAAVPALEVVLFCKNDIPFRAEVKVLGFEVLWHGQR